MRRNVYSSVVFVGGRPLCTQFYLDRVVPHQPSLASENYRHWATRWWWCILQHSLILTQYRSVTDRQTDGQTYLCESCKNIARNTAIIHFNTFVNLASSSCFFNSVSMYWKSTVSFSTASSQCNNFLLFLFLFFLAALLPTLSWFSRKINTQYSQQLMNTICQKQVAQLWQRDRTSSVILRGWVILTLNVSFAAFIAELVVEKNHILNHSSR